MESDLRLGGGGGTVIGEGAVKAARVLEQPQTLIRRGGTAHAGFGVVGDEDGILLVG